MEKVYNRNWLCQGEGGKILGMIPLIAGGKCGILENMIIGRGAGIRTLDPLLPKQVR